MEVKCGNYIKIDRCLVVIFIVSYGNTLVVRKSGVGDGARRKSLYDVKHEFLHNRKNIIPYHRFMV